MRKKLLALAIFCMAAMGHMFGQCTATISGPSGVICNGDVITLTASVNGSSPDNCTQSVNISNTTTTVNCGDAICFYDSGGPNGNYGTSESYVHTFTSNNNSPVTITFLTGAGETCCDYITVFDGVGTGGTQLHYGLLGTVNGNVSYTSTSSSLTVRFTSDGSVVGAGWSAIVSCDACSDYTYLWSNGATSQSITVAPTTSTTYTVTVQSGDCCYSVATYTVNPSDCVNNCNGFEDAVDRSEWTLVNGTQTNQWVIGTGTNNGGQYSLYVSNAPTSSVPTNAYSNTTSYVWAYKDIEFPECDEDYVLNFDWKCGGESSCDYMAMWIGPEATVTAGSMSAPGGATSIINPDQTNASYQTYFNTYSSYNDDWHHAEILLANATYSGQMMRLYVLWKNDGSVQNYCPAALDNVCLQACSPCDQPIVEVTPASATLCQGESVTLRATATGGAGNYTYSWSPAEGLNTTNGPTVTATPQATTTYVLRVTDGSECARTVRIPVELSGTTLSISQSPAVYCQGSDPVTLTADLHVEGSCSNYTYRWSTGATGTSITPVPQQNTTYTVTATPVGGDCCELTATHTVEVGQCSNECNDFETPADRADWTLVNGTQSNQWVMSTGTNNGGQYSLYVSNEPGLAVPGNTYTNTTSYVWAYKDIEFTECDQDFILSFDWKCGGESSCDYMAMWLGPEATVTAGSMTAPTGATQLRNPDQTNATYQNYFNTYGNYNGEWHHAEITLDHNTYSGQMMRLYVMWKNDGSVQNYCPAAIDNVCLLGCQPCDQPVVNVIPTSATLCQGESATFTATATGGAGNYTFTWSPADGLNTTNGPTVTATPQNTTTYALRVTDGADCAKTVRIPVEISGTTLEITQSPAVYCRGTDPVTLNATLNIDGSCTNYNYVWSTGATSEIATDIPQQTTTYTVTATPVGNDCCILTATHTVDVGDCNQDCNDFETAAGRAEWTLVNGTQANQWVINTAINNGGQYSMYISNSPTSSVPAHSYNSSSASNVWAYKEYEFPECDEDFVLSFDWIGYGESCCDYIQVYIGDQATVTAGSNTPPANATLLNTTNFNLQSTWQHVEYTLPSADYGGQLKTLYFLWHNDGSVGTMPPGGIDNVCLQACIPCDQPVVQVTPASVILCQGESATFTASATGGSGGGYTYTWSPGNTLNTTNGETVTATPNETTTYRVRVVDGEGCAKTVRVVAEVSGTRLNLQASPAGFCAGSEQPVTITANLQVEGSCSGYTYLWNTGATGTTYNDNPTISTQYTVTATPNDPSCCELIASTTVAVMDCAADGCPSVAPAELETGNIDIYIDCATQPEVTLNANVMATAVEADDYFVFPIPYAPPFGYTDGTRIFAQASDDTWSEVVNLPFTFCYYGNTYNQVVAGANSVATFNTEVAGNGCAWSFDESIPDAGLFPNTIFACYRDIYPSTGDFNPVTGDGGIFEGVLGEYPCRCYKLSFNNIKLFSCTEVRTFSSMIVLYEGTNIIDIYLRDAPTCTSWNDGNGLIGLQNSDCSRGITPPGRNTGPWTAHEEAWRFMPPGQPSYHVTWYEGPDTTGTMVGEGELLTIAPTVTSDYTARLQYTACNGDYFDLMNTCHITVNSETPPLRMTASKDTLCPDEEVTITAVTENAVSYIWNTGDTVQQFTLVPDQTVSTYAVTVTFDNGCTRSDSITVYAVATIDPPTFTVEPEEICAGERSIITANDYAHYHWSTGSTDQSISVTPQVTTTYSLTVSDEVGCSSSAETQVIVHPTPVAAFAPEQYLTFLEDGIANVHFIDFSQNAFTWVWDFGDQWSNSNTSSEPAPDHIYTHSGIYTVHQTVISDFGCTDSTSHMVSIQKPFYFYVPNCFTPDGDGINEIWLPQGEGVDESNYDCYIYDRFGRLVFHTDNLRQGWDGTENGKKLPLGTYVYVIQTSTMDNVPKEYVGTVTILK